MNKFLLVLCFVISMFACSGKKNNEKIGTPNSDTIVYEFNPNQTITTFQYLDDDSLNLQIVQIKCLSDSLLLREVYCNSYMTSEYDAITDSEHIYYYNKEKKLLIHYSYCWLDSSKYVYRYFNGNNDCHIIRYRYIGKTKEELDSVLEKDARWQYFMTSTEKYDDLGNLVNSYDAHNEIRYAYKYKNNRLVEEKACRDNDVPYWTESIEYKNDTVKRAHVNHDSFPIPCYTEYEVLNNDNNVISREKYDNENDLMRRYEFSYDSEKRLAKMQCFDEKGELKVTHHLKYESMK